MNNVTINFDDFNAAKDYDPYRAYPKSKLALMSFTQLFNQRYKGIMWYEWY